MLSSTRRSGSPSKIKTDRDGHYFSSFFIVVVDLCFCPPSDIFVGASVRCILYWEQPIITWRAIPCAACGHLLLPGGWQHVHYWACSEKLWVNAGEACQTAASPKEWPWGLLPVERPQCWYGSGVVWGQVPHHTMRCLHKGRTLAWSKLLSVSYSYCLPFWNKNKALVRVMLSLR